MKKNIRGMMLVAACGAAASVGSGAMAQDQFVINAFGATLLQSFLQSQSLGNDFIDIDLDGVHTRLAVPDPDPQIAAFAPCGVAPVAPFLPTLNRDGNASRWVIQYRAVGSVGGLQDLVTWGGRGALPYATVPPTNPADTSAPQGDLLLANPMVVSNVSVSWNGATILSSVGALSCASALPGASAGTLNGVPLIGGGNPGWVPFRSRTDGTFRAMPWNGTLTGPNPIAGDAGGVRNDVAPIDVPSYWGIRYPGAASPSAKPTQPGYGQNPRQALSPTGQIATSTFATNDYRLVDVTAGGLNIFVPGAAPNPLLVSTAGATGDRTIFDTQIAWAPIVPVGNLGAGLTFLYASDLAHLATTGRRLNGENLIQICRAVESGTHNGYMNSIGVDPSFGVGENVGGVNNSGATNDRAGDGYLPSNKLGTGNARTSIRNTRLGIGYLGGDTIFAQSGVDHAYDIVGTVNDLNGRAVPAESNPAFVNYIARPDTNRVFNNGLIGQTDPTTGVAYTVDGWQIGGKAVLSSIGNPLLAPANRGGFGWQALPAVNLGTPAEQAADTAARAAFPAAADMDNVEAAAFLNNISRSIERFNLSPTGSETNFTPGRFIATRFIPIPSVDRLQADDGTLFPVNPQLTPALQAFVSGNATLVYNSPVFGAGAGVNDRYAFSGRGANGLNGGVPQRRTTRFYSDNPTGATGGIIFTTQGAGTIDANVTTVSARMRNRIVGDFNGDGLRNLNDAQEMLRAWRQRSDVAVPGTALDSNPGTNPNAWVAPAGSGAIAGAPGADACIELLGDFNNDGSFGRRPTNIPSASVLTATFVQDFTDVRYWADGLAIAVSGPNAGRLDRKAGFTAVDTAWQTITGNVNFFGTTKATSAPYAAGDSRADVARNFSSGPIANTTRGATPIGADGVINGFDIDYVHRQFLNNPGVTDGAANWSNTAEAAFFDLSADMNGDLIVNCDDITEIVVNVLGTQIGDLNLDGNRDAADAAIATANLGLPGTYTQGDVNCDGLVTSADVDIINGGGTPACDSVDFNNDGVFPDDQDLTDFIFVLGGGFCGTCNDVDFNNDGVFPDDSDLEIFLFVLGGGSC